jgi:hypothetical protein
VIGSIAGLLLLMGTLLFTQRRRKMSTAASDPDYVHEKAQLHGDCIPKQVPYHGELRPEYIHELDASVLPELDAQVKHELEAVERGGEVSGFVAQLHTAPVFTTSSST